MAVSLSLLEAHQTRAMTQMVENPLEDDQKDILIGIAEEANESLEEAASRSANRAFNLGCLVGILPICAIVVGAFALTRFSWVGAFVMLVLMSLGLVLASNVIASIARNNATKKLYTSKIHPQIQNQLHEMNITEEHFTLLCLDTLPAGSALLQFLPPVTRSETETDTPPGVLLDVDGESKKWS